MRTAFAYTSARILMFGVSVIVLYVAGARGLLLLGLGLVISALGSYILLNKQRQIIADRLNSRLSRVGAKATEFRERLEEGTGAEDPTEEVADDAVDADNAAGPASLS
jgi:UPF0716 family protein affecting phage T7 exclusion